MSLFDGDAVHAWLDRLYGDAPGLLAVAHQDAGGRFRAASGIVEGIDNAAQLITSLERAQAHSIYLRTTTLTARPAVGERGGANLASALPGLWADVDFGDIGHRHDPARHDGRSLPPDADEARRIVTESGLPAPSLWVHSGGGLYPWWLLDTPTLIDDGNRAGLEAMSALCQQALQRSAHRLGYEYGAGVGDLARVLRVPGTVNRKEGQERPCRLLEDTGTVYLMRELQGALTAVQPTPAPPAAATAPAPRAVTLVPHTGTSAFDLLDQHVTFDDILTGAGWTTCTDRHAPSIEQCWTRPGHPEHTCSAHTLMANPHVLVVFSESAGLPVGGGQKLTRGRLFAHLHHHGDERAAAVDLFAATAGRPSTRAAAALPLPRETTPVRHDTIGLQNLIALEHQAARLQPAQAVDGVDAATADDELEAQLAFHRDVHRELSQLRVRAEAKRRLAAELNPLGSGESRKVDGASFILDAPSNVPAIWGTGNDVLWALGESLMIGGPPGVGKTTVSAQLVRARLGLGDRHVLGLPVATSTSKVLYLAMDRPMQISRAMARLFTPAEREALRDRLIVRPGPPPRDLAAHPEILAEMALEDGADTVFVDSLKDAAIGLTEDEVGAGYNRARQLALANGVQLVELHHLVKRGPNGAKPNTLADLYGSAWLTAGAGSVVLLWGEAGDPIVELTHLKQPATPIGPWKVLHDHDRGHSTVWHSADLLAMARRPGGLTAKAAAGAMFDSEKTTPAQVEKARRRLEALTRDGSLTLLRTGDKATNTAAAWGPSQTITDPFTGTSAKDPLHGITQPSRETTFPQVRDHHGTHHDHHAAGTFTNVPPSIEGDVRSGLTQAIENAGGICPECCRFTHAPTCTRKEAS